MAQTPVRFSVAEDERLIRMVARHSILWNMADAAFKNVSKKNSIWKEIAKMVNKTTGQCKIRWRSIRDHYKRQRKQERNAEPGSAVTKKRASYWDRLSFLDTFEDDRGRFSNTRNESPNNEEMGDDSEAMDDPLASDPCDTSTEQLPSGQKNRKQYSLPGCSPYKMKTKKLRKDSIIVNLVKERKDEQPQSRKYLDKVAETEEEDDDVDLFFKTMAATVKKFDPEAKTEAKMKIFNLVTEMEIRHHRSKRYVSDFPTFHYENIRPNSAASHSSYCGTGEMSGGRTPSPALESSADENEFSN